MVSGFILVARSLQEWKGMVVFMVYLAETKDVESILRIVSDTVSGIYPHYYPKGVVCFFLQHHCFENILDDVNKQNVYIISAGKKPAGTITIKGISINRLFVLPEYQGRGYGRQLMDFAEKEISRNYTNVHIDSSLPAKEMYLKLGYKEIKTCHINANYGDVLVYMKWRRNCKYRTRHVCLFVYNRTIDV